MLHEPHRDLAANLNAALSHHGAWDVLTHARSALDRLALVSSFGAESVVLLHLVSIVDRTLPVIFIDTEMLFTETLEYQHELTERLGLENVTIIRNDPDEKHAEDPDGTLHRREADRCCALRKTRPLIRALAGFDGWVTGRKRYQGGERRMLDFFETEAGTGRIKVNPLARWSKADVAEYMTENRLPRHPMVARGYASIGCDPCTSPVGVGEDERAGRWRGEAKSECGIHLVDGRIQPISRDVKI